MADHTQNLQTASGKINIPVQCRWLQNSVRNSGRNASTDFGINPDSLNIFLQIYVDLTPQPGNLGLQGMADRSSAHFFSAVKLHLHFKHQFLEELAVNRGL
jgi:hypothetical protein